MKYRYTMIVERDENGMYITYCPALQGCYTQGETYEEVMKNIKDLGITVEEFNKLR